MMYGDGAGDALVQQLLGDRSLLAQELQQAVADRAALLEYAQQNEQIARDEIHQRMATDLCLQLALVVLQKNTAFLHGNHLALMRDGREYCPVESCIEAEAAILDNEGARGRALLTAGDRMAGMIELLWQSDHEAVNCGPWASEWVCSRGSECKHPRPAWLVEYQQARDPSTWKSPVDAAVETVQR